MSTRTFGRSLALLTAAALAGGSLLAGPLPATATPSPAAAPKVGTEPDFNGDGYADLAIRSAVGHGALHITYGSATGLKTTGSQRFDEDNIASIADVNVYTFAIALAPGDFNGDGYGDLAVTVEKLEPKGEDVSGAVLVLFGSAAGLTATGSQYITHAQVADPPHSTWDDSFGYGLAAGNFGRGQASDLAMSSTREGYGGVVHVVYGSATGLDTANGQLWSRATPGVKGSPNDSPFFGWALAADDFDGSGLDDLAIGAPGAKVGKIFGAGAVHVLYATAKGLTAAGDELWSLDSPGIKGSAKATPGFGSELASGHFAGRKAADLVVARELSGTLAVIPGSSKGLTATGDQVWSSKTKGLPKGALSVDGVGAMISADFGRNPSGKKRDDLVVCGVGPNKTGAALVIYGASKGLSATGSRLFTPDTPGIPEVPGDGEGFCDAVAAAKFSDSAYASLAIGSQKRVDDDEEEDEPNPDPGPPPVVAPGTVHFLPATKNGLTTTGVVMWTSESLGRPADAYGFGGYLAASGR